MTTTPASISLGADLAGRSIPIELEADPDRRIIAKHLLDRVRGAVRFSRHDRMLYATDASHYQVEPLGVVTPLDREDLQAAVRACAERRIPMLPRGGGTSLAGQCVNHAVVIDVSPSLTAVHSVDPERMTCDVDAGINLEDLNRHLRPSGLFFAPDPSTIRQANVGGCIGNNAAGTRSVRYGRTSENLVGIDTILASGETVHLCAGAAAGVGVDAQTTVRRLTDGVIEIVRRHESGIRDRFPKTLRRNAGYGLDMILAQLDLARRENRNPLEVVDLAALMCGSEGTLAVTAGATLRLHRIPPARGLAVIGFASLDEAIASVEPLLALDPSAVELLDDMIVGLAARNRHYRHAVTLMPQPQSGDLNAILYVEFMEPGAADVTHGFERVRAVMNSVCPNASLATYTDAAAMSHALELRRAGEPLLHGIPGHRKPLGFVEDNAVPVSRLGEFVRRFQEVVRSHGTQAAFYAHASVGVLHVRPLLDLRDADDRVRMESIATEVADLAQELGGVMSGEHGDGRVRGPLLERYFGRELMNAFRAVKTLFDPHGLLNPGNIVTPESIETIHESTRIRPHGTDLDVAVDDTWFDYGDDGFGHAVELCNGSGVCRKRSGGVMCPSYRATLDERHSTRGRGNALRLAMTGQLTAQRPDQSRPAPQWNDQETLETLDLCLSCKACKSECPSNVDLAQYKAEYLAQSFRQTGHVPMAARFVANVRRFNRIGSWFAPLSHRLAELPPSRLVLNRLLDFAPQRPLPKLAPSLFRRFRKLDRGVRSSRVDPRPVVILYADCFTAFNEPEIGVDARAVLEAFGYRVVLPDCGCCGRSSCSAGVLDAARAQIRDSATKLARACETHHPVAVLFLEPSCHASVLDEWQSLKQPPTADAISAETLAWLRDRSKLVESFLVEGWDDHPERPDFQSPAGRIAVHTHCHQKALNTASASADFMRKAAGDDAIDVLDTGCCGMAGSFGYKRSHYEISMAIGELSVFPLVRTLGPNDVVIAPGTSCRHQIIDGTDRVPMHPLTWAARNLAREIRN